MAAVNRENALFDRTAMVGLITPVGAILMGRMYTPGYEVFAAADTFENGTAGTWGGITGGTAGFTALGADIRSQKSIQYRIATPAGIGGSVMYGCKNSGYLGRYNKFYGAAVTYKANGFDVGVAHNRGYDQNDRKSLATITIGGSYTMGDFKFFAGYHDQKNQQLGADARLHRRLGHLRSRRRWPRWAPATAGALRNVFVTNITRNTQIDAASYQIGLHYRIGAGRIMASVRARTTVPSSEQRCHPVRHRLRLQPVQAHRRLHRRRASTTRTTASTPRAPQARQAASPRFLAKTATLSRSASVTASDRVRRASQKDACGRLFLCAARRATRLELRILHSHCNRPQ